MGSPAVDRKVKAVAYKLKGERIKAALATNPGKIIITARQSGKTTELAGFLKENYPDGAIIFCFLQVGAEHLKKILGRKYFNKCIVVYSGVECSRGMFEGENLPIFADEFCSLSGVTQKTIVRDERFMGGVSSPPELVVPEVKDLCILC